MSAFRDTFVRRRQELNPLTTSLGPAQQAYPTPITAAPLSAVTLSSPYGYMQQAYTPLSAVRQYNPQQWGQSPIVQENAMRFAPSASQEIEAPAPPPYSPPRSNRPAGLSPDGQVSQSSASPAAAQHRPSPEPQSVPAFPPPPVGHSRMLSRDRQQPLFSLGAFSRNRPAAPEPSRLSSEIGVDQVTNSDLVPGPRRPLQMSIDTAQPAEELDYFNVRPPASRRAASAGAVCMTTTPPSCGTLAARWEPGMPLPPPPPGPPPQSSSRSQSLTRTPDPIASPPTRRPQPISNLGPIPPTPAGWVDESPQPARGSLNPGLRIDTSTPAASSTTSEMGSSGSSAGLSRSRAVRVEPKSIRERRSESRNGRAVPLEALSNNPWAEAITPSDITVPMTVLGGRPTINKSTPRSSLSTQSQQSADTPNASRRISGGTPIVPPPTVGSRSSTTRPASSSTFIEAPTPPFSPDAYHAPCTIESPSIPPKSLPTPPPQSRRSTSSTRPTQHAPSVVPVSDSVVPAPLSILAPASIQSPASTFSPSSFCQSAIQRHTAFAKSEAAAATDGERVRLFAEFIVSESRLRRDRYASAIDAMGSELLELTRDLFRPRRESAKSLVKRYSDGSDVQSDRRIPYTLQTGSATNSTPPSTSEFPSQSDMGRDNSYHCYKPSLSPIASMTTSEALDESSSRGRPSSRWWEVGQSGPQSPTLSKRESKYMGVPKEARESLQWEGSSQPSSSSATVNYASYGPNEYPPEKGGRTNGGSNSPVHGKTPTNFALASYSPAPATPNPKHLDVSRLVTLPPPYPRHYPAVNNNHPDLSDIRTSVRALSELSEVKATKGHFRTQNNQMSDDAASAAAKRRQSLLAHIQLEIQAGAMSYADAAKLEAESAVDEAESSKSQSKASFDLFQSSVVTPLNELLMDRIHHATTLYEQLRSKLSIDAQQESPNVPQEEGDEQPELLEKLTLLKWIFEARETLHREVYDLLSERNDRYKDMVTEPYRLAGNEAKATNAELFFAEDVLKRKVEFETEALGRTMEFMDIVESNVLRGVEVQLSAFWDIAPPLRSITDRVPKTLTRDFGVVIPREEYDDNPDYARFPLQYLYHLLQHGEKSTYQFIESQINLLCLLHEAKSAIAEVKGRVDLAEATRAGDRSTEERVRAEIEREERRLTDDLKEKVRCVEEQWASSLGKEFEGVRERVKLYLMNEGGWEGVED